MKEQKKKINISVDDETYTDLQKKAKEDYIRLATYVKQLISKKLNELNKKKCRDFPADDDKMEK